MDYDSFIVAHLIKFEKPQKVAQFGGTIQGVATDYTYITDAQHDILYDDGASDKGGSLLGVQNYRANKVLQIGTINENIQAKASNMSLKLDTAALGAQTDSNISFTSTEITGDVDLMEVGFQEGDKIKLTRPGSSNNNKHVRIDSFKNGGKTIVYTAIDTITSIGSAQIFTISLAAEEINSILLDKESSSYTNYINREVLIYKVHINPETRAIIGEPFLYFKGITSGATINEKLESSEITWTLSSHWGDFIRVQGRLTDDATHRALQIDGSPDLNSVLRSDYATDLGFIHSNTAVNHLATYMAKEKDYKQVDINGGWPGGKRLREIEIEVPRQTDLQFNLQAKMLPVVYGVRKIDSFPVFVDTHKDSSAELYKVDALCEGKIAGVLDVYVEGNPRICLDKSDFNTRNTEGTDYDADTVEVQCAGRADRGDTLSSYSAEPTPAEIEEENAQDKQTFQWIFSKRFQKQVATKNTFFHRILFLGGRPDDPEEETDSGADNAEQVDATGIGHRGTHTMDSPISADLTFHQGLPDQHADNTLVNLAANNKFKIQNDYYPANATNPYWSPSHRLLDTAYVMGKYTIADGETSIPKFEYIVRGRDPECYNYDGSYRQETKYSSAAFTAFGLGDSVTLHETGTNTQIGSAVDIIDKWVTFDSDGIRDYRFRFSTTPALIDANGDPITAFYMKSGTDKWYMQTWDHTELTTSPASKLSSTSFTSSAGSSRGRKYSFTSMSAHLEDAISHPSAQLGITSSSTDTMLASTFEDFDYNSDTNVIDNLTHLSDDPGSTEVVVKNAIRLSSSASAVNDFYNGATITVTHTTSDGTPYTQERTVVDYIGSSRVAIVDAPWDWQHIPDNNDTFSIGSIGDRRVTLNPSMQLLDYLTNKRYGKGLDITDDINLEQFKEAAAKCDTRSTVSIVFSTTTFSEGEKYQYPQSGNLQWRGTVDKIQSVGNKKVVTFKDVIGKLGCKWNSYKTFANGEVYWYDGKVYLGSGTTEPNTPGDSNGSWPGGSGAETSLTLYKVGGGTANVDISTAAANGNPIVKNYSSVTGEFSASGYSLYDCDDIKYWKYLGWDDGSQRNVTRHQMNQVVDTKIPLFENINKMLYQFNGMLKYTGGKYGLEVKGQKGTIQPAEQISDEDIIGTIKLSDKGLKQSKNYVSTAIIDPANKFEGRSVSFFNSTYLKEDKGVQKKGQISQQGVTNYFNARFNIQQYLDESRYGLTIQFTMAPRGLLLTAGTIIELTYPRFGYSSKEFRITNLNFKKDGTVDITADEHNDNAYVVPEIGAGGGFGVVETPEVSAANVQKLATPAPPTSLQCSQTNTGEIVLSWNNSATFSSATHLVEVYSSSVNNFSNSTDPVSLIGTSTTNIYHDPVTDGEGNKTRYYWIRYQVRTPQLNLAGSDFRNVPSNYLPATPQDASTHTGIQGIGQAAFAVRTIDIDPGDETAFVYNNAGDGIQFGNDNNTVLSTTTHNTSGTESFKWYKKGPSDSAFVEQSGETSSSFTFTAPSNFSDMPQTIKVELTDTLSDGTTLTAENQFTFIGLRTVEDAYTVLTTASSFNFQASESGVIDGPGAFSTDFSVRKGGTVYTYDGTSTYDADSYRYGTITNITPSGSVVPEVAANGTVSISTSSGNFLTGTTVTQCTFDVPILDNADGSTIATSRIVLSKSLDGINARAVKLSAPEQVIAYDSAGATPDPSASFEITATPFNTTGTPYYEFFKGAGSIQASSTDSTLTYTAPSSYSTLPEVITVKLREDSAVGSVLATDTFTVFGVKEATDAVDQKTVFIFRLNDPDGAVGFDTDKDASDQTFADPLEGLETGWSTSQQALGSNNDVIYMSQRTFTSDGSSPQQNSWSTPVVAARRIDGTSFTVVGSVSSAATANVKFRLEKNAHPDVNPAYETDNILISGQSNTQYSVTIPSDHANIDGNDFGSFLMYVSPRDVPVNISTLVLNASSDTGSTNEPNFSDVFGGTTISSPPIGTAGAVYEHPTGSGTETWGGFANSESTLKRPTPISFSSDGTITFDAFVPNADSNAQSTLNAAFGSASAGDAVIAQDSGNLWIYNGTQWNDVGKIKGDAGTDGINEKRVYLFAKNPDLDENTGLPPAITADAGQQTYAEPTSGVINGWTTTQGSLTADDDIIYMVQRLFTNGGTGTESSWSTPIVISQRIDGVSPDALTVSSSYDASTGVTTLEFSDDSTATITDGTNAGVKVIYADDANGTNASFTQGTKEFVNYYEWTGSAPSSVPSGLTYTKFVGEPGDNEGVLPIYAEDANGTNASFTMGSKEFVNFYEWTGTAPSTVPSGLTYVKFVGEDGNAGADPILLAYDNSSHVVPVSTSGTAVFTGSGGVLQVYEGATELAFHQNAQSNAFPSTDYPGKFNVDITKVSGDTLTEPTNSGSGSVGAIIGDFTANPVTLTQVTKYKLTAYIRAAGGSTYTRSIDVSLVPADQGATGPDGLRSVSGHLYYEDTTGTAPSAPGGTTYTFNTGLVSGDDIDENGTTNCWKNSNNTMSSTSTNTYYVITYQGVEAAANSSTLTVSYGAIKTHTSFDGVVTFTDGDFSLDGTTIDTIDGTKVQLGSTALSSANVFNSNTTQEDVGLDLVLNHAQVRADLVDAPNSILNDQVSINADGTLSNAGSGQVSASGIGAETLQLNSSGSKPVTITGNKISVGDDGTNGEAWNTHVYSKDGYPAASVSFVADQNDAYLMVGLSTDPTDSVSYTNMAYSWFLMTGGSTRFYQGDTNLGNGDSYSVGDKFTITYDGVNVQWFHNGNLKKTVAVTISGNLHMDSSFKRNDRSISKVQFVPTTDVASLPAAVVGLDLVDNKSAATILSEEHTGTVSGNVTGTLNSVAVGTVTSGAAEGAQVQAQQSLLPRGDDSEWTIGQYSARQGIWTKNGANNENVIELAAGPFGTITKVWKSEAIDGLPTNPSDSDGGFQNTVAEDRFSIVDNVPYRFTAFVKQNQADGTVYFGIHNYNSSNSIINIFDANGTGGDTNKYWWNGDLPRLNEWYLFVGFVNPDGHNIDSTKSGLYKVSTGERVTAFDDTQFNASAAYFAVRTYLYYSSVNSGTVVQWAHPRVDRMDRAAPSIMQLLANDGAVLNREISINADGSLNNAGSGAVTATGLGAESLELLSGTTTNTGDWPDAIFIRGNKATVLGPNTKTWNTHVYSKDGYETASVSFVASQDDAFIMVGLNTDPDTNVNYQNIDYAFYLRGQHDPAHNTDHKANFYISGSSYGTPFTYSAGDKFTITYDGVKVKWFHNGTLKHSVDASVTGNLHMDSSFYGYQPYNTTLSLSSIEKISFIPITSIKTVPKESVGLENVSNHEQVRADLVDAPSAIKNDQITLSNSSGTLSLDNAGAGSITLAKGDVGLGNVTDGADITAETVSGLDFIDHSTGNDTTVSFKGNRIQVADAGTEWGTSAWYSKDGYNKGCMLTFTVPQDNKRLMFGLNTNPSSSTSFTDLDYAWYFRSSGGNGIADIYEGGSNVDTGNIVNPFSAGDRFTITYDGVNIRYYHNGSLERTVAATITDALHADGTGDDVAFNINNVSFMPISSNAVADAPAGVKNNQISINSDGTLSNAGSGQVSAEGIGAETLELTSGGSKPVNITGNKISVGDDGSGIDNWNTHVYSKDGYPAASVSFVADQTSSYIMAGLNTDPTTNTSYTSLDYAWYLRSNGTLRIYESGDSEGDFGSYSVGDKFAVIYDGVSVKYFQNGTLKRTVTASIANLLHFDSSFARNNKSISKVQFVPTTDVASLPAAVVGLDLVDNKSAATILSEEHTGDVSGTINNVSASTVSSGAIDGAQVQAQQSLLPRADDSEWNIGAVDNTGFVNGIWARNGSGGDENTIVLETGPFGTATKVWRSISTDASSNDGGFHNNGNSQRFPIEDDVTYRFSVFVKQSDNDGSMYFGAYNYNDTPENIDMFKYDGSVGDDNKYWFYGDLPTLNEWYLFVGFVNPSDTSINSNKGGLYKVSTGERAVADNDIRFNSNADTFAIRTYLFYSSTGSGTTVRWAHPRVDRMDRSAPTIMQLLGSENAVLNREVSINADGSLNNAGSGAVTIGGLGGDTLTIISGGTKPVQVVGNTIKVFGTTSPTNQAGWNTHAYSKEGYEACAVMYQVESGSGSYFVGLNTDPANNTSFNTIDYAIYNNNGIIEIRKNGSTRYGPSGPTDGNVVHSFGTYSAGDTFAVTYDGVNVKFYHNGALITYIEDTSINSLLHMDTSFYTVNRQISRVAFKPLTSIRTVPKESVGLGNVNNPSSAVTPIAVADVSPNIGGEGQSKILGSVIRAGTTIVAGEGTNKAGLTGTAADGTIGTAQNSAETDIRIFAGSEFGNRANAPFRVQQNGGFRAEFGHIGGFSIGEDALVSTSEQPIITLGQNLASNPSKQITLTSRSADEYMLFAGIEVPQDGVGIKKSDNPPFGVDKNGKVDMRSFELRDDNGQIILSSTNLLSGVLLSQINSQLKAGSQSVTFTQETPNNVVRIVTTSSQTIDIDFELVSTAFRVLGMHKSGFTQTQAFSTIPDSISVEVEYRSGTSGGFSPFGTVTFTGVDGAEGSNPGPSATQYWIHVEEYHARTRGDCYRSEIVAGHGCFNNSGNIVGSVSRTLSAGTYEFRINQSTSSSKNITIATRAFNPPVAQNNPTQSQASLDTGYGDQLYYSNATPANSYMITNKRIFTVSGNGPAYAVDINHSPIKITEGKTFEDFLGLTGGIITGDLEVDGTINVNSTATKLDQGTNASLKVITSHGHTMFGPQNGSWSHFYTDRPRYYFDKGITVDTGLVGSYNEVLQLQVSGTTRCQLSSTNISAQNGAKFSGAGAIGYVDVTYNSDTDDDQVVPYSIPTGTKPIAAVVVSPNQGTTGTDGNGNGFDMATIRNLKQGSMIVNRYDIEHGTPDITMRIYYTTTDT